MNSSMILLILLVVAAVIVLLIHNQLVALMRRCDRAFADIDVQLKQRHDLIPNLVEAVKGYAVHERATLEAVISARAAAKAAPTPAAQMQAEAKLGVTLGNLFAVAEAYPELKASENFTRLSDEISDVEYKLAATRRFLNTAVSEYNTALEQMPANLVALMMGFEQKAFFDLGVDERARLQAAAPAVKF
jgi:LemA protein